MNLEELTRAVLKQAKEKKFGANKKDINIPEKFALLHSEVSEAYEAYRKKKSRLLEEELADTLQRLLHLAGILGIDLEKAIIKKMKKNSKRKWDFKKLNESHA